MTVRKILEWAPDDNPNVDDPTYVEIAQRFLREDQEILVSRGRQNELQRFDTGEANFILDNRGREWDNFLATSPGFNRAKPIRRFRFRLDYPWLPAKLINGAMNRGTTGWQAVSSSATLAASTAGVMHPLFQLPWLEVSSVSPHTSAMRIQGVGINRPDAAVGQAWTVSARTTPITGLARDFRIGIEFLNASSASVGLVWSPFTTADPTKQYILAHVDAVAPMTTATARPVMEWAPAAPAAANTQMLTGVVMELGEWAESVQFVGFADGFTPEWGAGRDSIVHVPCSDMFKLLANKKVNSSEYSDFILSLSNFFYYRLGDPLGARTAFDSGPHANHAKIQGNVVFNVDGALLADVDSSLYLNGELRSDGRGSGYVDLGGAPALTLAQNWSLTAWVNNGDLNSVSQVIYSQSPKADPSSLSGNVTALLLTGEPKLPKGETSDPEQDEPPGGILTFYTRQDNFDVIKFWAIDPETGDYFRIKDGTWHLVTVNLVAVGLWEMMIDGRMAFAVGIIGGAPAAGHQDGYRWFANWRLSYGPDVALLGGFAGQAFFNGFMDEVVLLQGSSLTLEAHQTMYQKGRGQWGDQYAGQRITQVLDTIGINTTDRDIRQGTTKLSPVLAPLAQTNALEYVRTVEVGEAGFLYVPGSGKISFRGHQDISLPPYTVVQGVFGDLPGTVDSMTGLTELPCYTPEPEFAEDLIYNEFQGSIITQYGTEGPTRLVTDEASRAEYWDRTLERPRLLLNDDDTLIAYLEYLRTIYREPLQRYSSITLVLPQNPGGPFSEQLWHQALSRDILDRIAVIRRPPPGGSPAIRLEQMIQGVQWKSARNSDIVIWSLGAVTTASFLRLDDPVRGLLDSNNVYGF